MAWKDFNHILDNIFITLQNLCLQLNLANVVYLFLKMSCGKMGKSVDKKFKEIRRELTKKQQNVKKDNVVHEM